MTPSNAPHANRSWIELRPPRIHGTGVFARRRIRNETLLLEYVGEPIDHREANRRLAKGNPYLFYLDDQRCLDGSGEGNQARFVNHSCQPNSETVSLNGGVWILATRSIAAGEEVTMNYGFDLEDYREHPCVCGAPACVGYIVAEVFFDILRRRKTGSAARAR